MTAGGGILASAFIAAAMLVIMLASSTSALAPAPAPVHVSVSAAPTPVTMSVPAGAPGPAVDCQTALAGMADCLEFVVAGSNQTKPDPACCPELDGLLKNEPLCLCLLLGDTEASFGVQIDLTKALSLPSTCGLQAPSLSMCPAAPTPSEEPAATPGEEPAANVPGVSPIPGSPANGNNGVATVTKSGPIFLVCLASAFWTTLL